MMASRKYTMKPLLKQASKLKSTPKGTKLPKIPVWTPYRKSALREWVGDNPYLLQIIRKNLGKKKNP